ncbi:MAG: DUF190 domain-containing protein [Coriobacteriia bacterium]
MTRDLIGPAKRLMAYVSENETYEGKPLYSALVDQARKSGCGGATVLRGIEGFGATSVIHAEHLLRMSSDLPVVVCVIDEEHRIAALAEVFGAMVGDGLITIEDVTVLAYRGGKTV